jgi:hypothetical protein
VLSRVYPPQAVGSGSVTLGTVQSSIAVISDSVVAVLERPNLFAGGCSVPYRLINSSYQVLFTGSFDNPPDVYRGCAIDFAKGRDTTLCVLTDIGFLLLDTLHGQLQSAFDLNEDRNANLITPYNIACNPAGNVAITFAFTSWSSSQITYYLRCYAGDSQHQQYYSVTLPSKPSAVALDASGTAYVAFSGDGDANRDVVRAYAPGAGTVVLTHTIGTPHTVTLSSLGVGSDPLYFAAKLTSGTTSLVVLRGDLDADGLPDTWETYGIQYGPGSADVGPIGGAGYMHKDIFVQVDAMTGRMPSPSVFADLTSRFAALPTNTMIEPNPDATSGIALHIIPGKADIPPHTWAPLFWKREFYPLKAQYFDDADATPAKAVLRDLKARYIRYCVYADTILLPSEREGDRLLGLSGGAGSVDFVLGLGVAELNRQPTPGGLPAQQAAVFIHELGHCLGLRHGGDQEQAFKPNYRSLMNYNWNIVNSFQLANAPQSYQTRSMGVLDERGLVERDGVGGIPPESTTVRWTFHSTIRWTVPILRTSGYDRVSGVMG